jgi:dTDP-4-amino-4,6-dideoxygalactose transaminase
MLVRKSPAIAGCASCSARVSSNTVEPMTTGVDGPMRIPLYEPYLCGSERVYVNDCLNSGWISSRGEYVRRFEQAFGDFIGAEYCNSVCNGTVALHVALLAAGVGPGDEVIVPTLTYIAPVNAIAYVGAKPVFVDGRTSGIDIMFEHAGKGTDSMG